MWDPLCHAVFDKLKKANDAYKQFMNTGETATGSDLAEVEAVPFEGNVFGTTEDYALDTFGQLENDYADDVDMQSSGPDLDDLPPLSEVSDDEEDDEEMAHIVAELEESWEPHWEGAPHLEVEDDTDGPGNVKVQPNLEEEDKLDSKGDKQCNIGQFM